MMPFVSIFMITYNHENFIGKAIESVLMQKTSFPIKIFIGEDYSSDKTRDICLKYYRENPEIIELILNPQNIGATKNARQVFNSCFSSGAKYIAMLEGDDYWTDPLKLQKQIDFLEGNNDFAICFHNMEVIYDDGRKSHASNPSDQKSITTIEDLALGNYIYTASCVFRNGLIPAYPPWFANITVGDYVLHMLNAEHGKIKYLAEPMGVYRVHRNGVWESKPLIYRKEQWVSLIETIKYHFKQNIKELLEKPQKQYCIELMQYYAEDFEKCKYYSKMIIEIDPYFINNSFNERKSLENKIVLLAEAQNNSGLNYLIRFLKKMKRYINV